MKKLFALITVCCFLTLSACSHTTESASGSEASEARETTTQAMTAMTSQNVTAESTDEAAYMLALAKSSMGATATISARAVDAATVISRPSTSGALKVSGTQLTDINGDPVRLLGISTHGIAWFPDYINPDCFHDLAGFFGANLIRLAMYTSESGGYCTDGDREYLMGLIEKGVDYATEADMYVIIDWHILSDGNPLTHIAEAREFFGWAAGKFAGHSNVLYEICNEPNGATSWADIRSYAEEIIPVIRGFDEDAIIIVGTPNWSQYVGEAAADPIRGYEGIMYTLHFYAATHKDDLRNSMAAAVSAGLPIFVTEYGICDASGSGVIDITEADKWVALMDELGISYAAWNLSNKDESSAIIKSSCTKTSGFTYDDLSESGQWLYGVLHAGTP